MSTIETSEHHRESSPIPSQEYTVSVVMLHVPLDTVTGLEGARVTVGNHDNSSDAECGEVRFGEMIGGVQFIQCRYGNRETEK